MAKFDDCEFPSCLGTLVYIINSGIVFVVCVFCPFVNSFLNGHNLSCDWNFLIRQKGNFSVRWVLFDEQKLKFQNGKQVGEIDVRNLTLKIS